MPKVSVIIPTHNRAGFLSSAITSVLKQTYQDFEIIVVDDASTDTTVDVVKELKEERIKYIRQEAPKGPAGSRNTGVKNATGRYIAFLDDDDEWLPQKLKIQVDLLDCCPQTVGGVYTGLLRVDKTNGKVLDRITQTKRGNIFRDLLLQNFVTTSTILLKKECFEKVGLFDESMWVSEDYDLWIRISKEFKWECIKEPLVKYSATGNKISNDYEKTIEGYEILVKKYEKLFARNRKSWSGLHLSLGVLYCYNKNPAMGRKAFLKAIQLYPLEIRHYFNFGLSLLGANNFKKLKELKEQLLA